MKYLSIFTGVLFLLASCSKNEVEEPSPIANTYYPLEVGNEWIYIVDSLLISRNGQSRDTTTVLMRESIVSKDIDTEARKVFRVERAIRKDTTESWKVQSYFTLEYSDHRIIYTDYLPKVELVYPIRNNNTWNALAYTSKNIVYNIVYDDVVFYKTYDKSIINSTAAGTEAIEVVHMNSVSKIDLQKESTIYDKNIGPVYSNFEAYYDTEITDRPLKERADYGFKIEKKLIEHKVQ